MIDKTYGFLKDIKQYNSPHTFAWFGTVAQSVSSGSWATALTDWLKRKEITINGASKTATLDDNFTSSGATSHTSNGVDVGGWVTSDYLKTLVNGTNDNIDFNFTDNNTADNDCIVSDLTSISNTWVLQGKINFSSLTSTGLMFIGVSDSNQTAGTGTSQKSIGFNFVKGGTSRIRAVSSESGISDISVEGDTTWNPQTSTNYYFRVTRKSLTSYNVTIYSDSDYSEVLHSVTGTSASTNIGHQFIKICNFSDLAQTGNHTGTIDDIQFYNGVTTVENIPSQQTATASDDFTSYADTTAGDTAYPTSSTTYVRVNPTNDNIDFNFIDHATNTAIIKDLTTVSDTDWVLRLKMHLTSKSSNPHIMLGISDEVETSGDNNSQKMLGMTISSTGLNTLNTISVDGATPATDLFGGNTTSITALATSADYWIEIKRINTTTLVCTIFSDSGYSIVYGTVTETISGTTGLRYLKLMNHISSGTTSAVGTFDDIKFYNNITEVNPATLTDYPLTIKIQGDADLMEKTTETFKDDGTSYADQTAYDAAWASGDTAYSRGNPTNDNIDISFNDGGSARGIAYDLGTGNVDAEKWILRFKINFSVLSGDISWFMGMSDADETNTPAASQDSMGFFYAKNVNKIYACDSDSGAMAIESANSFTMTTATDYYFELKRTSPTSYTGTVYSDSGYSISLVTFTGTTTATNIDQHYITVKNQGLGYVGTATFTLDDISFWNGITNPVNQEVATFADDFNTDDWTDTGTLIVVDNATDERLEGSVYRNTAVNHACTYDLTSIDAKFVARFKLDILTFNGGTGVGAHAIFAFSENDGATTSITAQDHVSFSYHTHASNHLFRGESEANGSLVDAPTNFTTRPAVGTYYVEMIHDTGELTVNLFSDSGYSILTESITNTAAVEPTGLRYFKVQSEYVTPSTWNGSSTYAIDDFQFWNGVTSPNAEGRKIVFTDNAFEGDAVEYASETVSYDPINGDLEAVVKIPSLATGADTTIQMYYDYTPDANPSYVPEVIPTVSSILEQDFSADESWTHSSKTSISSGVLNWQNNATGTNLFHHAYRAIPQLKNDYFDVRFKLDIDVLSGSGNQDSASISWILCDANNTDSTSIGGTATGIGFRIGFGTTTYVPVFEAFEVEGTGFNQDNGGDNINFATTPTTGIIYIRLHRTSLTSVTVGIYSDSTYDTLTEEETLTITSTINDLDIFQISTRNGSNETTRSVSGTVDDFTIVNNNREQATWNGNYKAVHHLQGNSLDSTSNGNDGTDTAVAYEQQNNSVGAGFDGTTSYINAGSDASLDNPFNSGGTVSVTINPKSDGEGTEGRVIDTRSGGTGYIVYTVAQSGGFVKLKLYRDFSTGDGHWTTTNAVIPINEISIITVKYNDDSVSNNPIFIINGIKYTVGNGITEGLTPTGTSVTDASSNLLIGNESTSAGTFDGLIDNIRISDVTRPSSEAITSYNAEKSDSDIITVGSENTQ